MIEKIVNGDRVPFSDLNRPMDNVPTDGSSNPVKSDGIYDSEKDIYAVMGEMGAKNLISYPYYETTKTQNGVTFTDNGDGTVTISTVSGGATANTAMTLHARGSGEVNDLVLPNGNYVLSGCPSGGSSAAYSLRINITKNSSGIDIAKEYGNGVSVTLDGDDFSQTETNVGIYVFVASGTIITTPITFKPMFRLASDTDDTYQPYAKTNKQLTDEIATKAEVAKVAGKADKTATASGEVLALAPTSEGKALLHTAYGMSVQDGTPTPSVPVDIESAKVNLRSVGKNLIPYPYSETTHTTATVAVTDNGDGSITVNGTASSNASIFRFLAVGDGRIWLDRKKYKISFGGVSGTAGFHLGDLGMMKADGTTEVLNTWNDRALDNTDGTYLYIGSVGVYVAKNKVIDNVTYRPFLSLEEVNDSYEAYKHSDTTTNLTLRAIEVSSTDDYNLVRDNKYYIADTLDYSEDSGFVVTRRIKHDTFTSCLAYSSDGAVRLGLSVMANTDARNTLLCNFLLQGTGSNSMRINAAGTEALAYSDFKNTTEDWNTWLSSNPATVDYVVATPTTETITTEQALELLNLKTYDESTTISSQEEPSCTIAIEYAKERLGAVALTSYLDLATKANITDIPAPQIQSDWNQSDNTALDFIKNKPTIPSPQIQSDWNQSDSTALDFIKNKPEISVGLPPLPIDGWIGPISIGRSLVWTDDTNIYYSFGSYQYVLDKSTSTWSPKTWSGLTSFSGSYIWSDGTNTYYSSDTTNYYILDKSTSTWSPKTWSGLTSFNKNYLWSDGTNIYYSSSTTQYVLDKATSIWSPKTWTGLTSFYGNGVWSDGTNIYYSSGSKHYVLDKSTSTWSPKTWSGLTSIYGPDIWSDGTNTYQSTGTIQYVLDKSTSTWSTKTWSGLTSFNGRNIWTDGTNVYHSTSTDQFVLDKSTSTWNIKAWNTESWAGLVSLSGNKIWTDGTSIYYSDGSTQYILDKSTSTLSTKIWTGLTSFFGNNIWTDDTNIYYSSGPDQYVLDKATSTWSTKTWTGLTSFFGNNIWTDGTNIYFYSQDDEILYVLDKSTSTWSPKTWSGLPGYILFDSSNIWTDDTNIYYSSGPDQYVLDKATSIWSPKTWTGLTSFSGNGVWTDGTNIYYSGGSTSQQYVLDKSTSAWSPKTWSKLTWLTGGNIWTDGINIYYSSGENQYALYNGTWYPKSGRTTEQNYIAAVLAALYPTS